MKYSDLELRVVTKCPFVERFPTCYGMMVYARDTDRWLMIQRKHSIEFLLLMKGRYKISEVPNLISKITVKESIYVRRALIDKDSYTEVVTSIYNGVSNFHFIDHGWTMFYNSIPIIEKSLLINDIQLNNLKWLWCKGHNTSQNETCFETAKREFLEESGVTDIESRDYHISEQRVIYNISISPCQVQTIICWIAIFQNEFDTSDPDPSDIEVSDRRWFSTGDVYSLLTSEESEAFSRALNIINV